LQVTRHVIKVRSVWTAFALHALSLEDDLKSKVHSKLGLAQYVRRLIQHLPRGSSEGMCGFHTGQRDFWAL
jgi:hypothetical protein